MEEKCICVGKKLNKDTHTALFYELRGSNSIVDYILNLYYILVMLHIVLYATHNLLCVCKVIFAK